MKQQSKCRQVLLKTAERPTRRPVGLLAAAFACTMACTMAWACGDEDRVLFVQGQAEPSRQVAAVAPPSAAASDAGVRASSDGMGPFTGDAGRVESVVEGRPELPLDDSTAQDAPSDSVSGQPTALSELEDEQTAGAFCRWQAVLEQQQQGTEDAQCEEQALECQAEATGADGREQQLPSLMRTVTEDLLRVEGCDIPRESADRCVGELIVVLEPHAETMRCGQAPAPFPSLEQRVAELPSCLGILFVCPAALESLQQSLTAAL